MKEIYFAGGCFWGTEAYFKRLRGVVETCTGYANGRIEAPSYERVKAGDTGCAETVRVEYDERVIGLECLVYKLFSIIDPTLVDRQGGDVGSQYRTGVYYTDPGELPVIRGVFSRVQEGYSIPIVTEALPLDSFTPAEEYHQDYLDKNPGGYCHIGFDRIAAAADEKVWA